MVFRLSHRPQPVVTNFYQNSLKQCSLVQQKQIGLLVGAAVADAAARPLDGYTAEEIAELVQPAGDENALVFCEPPELRGHTALRDEDVAARPSLLEEGHRCGTSPCGLDSFAADSSNRGSSSMRSRNSSSRHTALGHSGLREHSFSYHFYFELLRTTSAARGDFLLSHVQSSWLRVAHAVHPKRVFAAEHASLLHVVSALLPIPTIYPYASDSTLRTFTQPFIDFLTEPMYSSRCRRKNDHHDSSCTLSNMDRVDVDGNSDSMNSDDAARAAVSRYTLSLLGVALRYLQSNPDAVRNAAFMSVPDSSALFPSDVACVCPPLASKDSRCQSAKAVPCSTSEFTSDSNLYRASTVPPSPSLPTSRLLTRSGKGASAALPPDATSNTAKQGSTVASTVQKDITVCGSALGSSALLTRSLEGDVRCIREGLTIARRARSYSSGVGQAIRLGGPTAQRALIVGALLGARFGARGIPLPWLSATVDHQPVATMAINVAQWTWNPPHH